MRISDWSSDVCSSDLSGERNWPWMLACGVLTLLLLAQLGWAKRDALIRDPTVGGWLRSSCAVLHCRLPLVAAPARLRLLASNVQIGRASCRDRVCQSV